MEGYLKQSEKRQVGISEWEHFLLSRGDGAISILSFAENACDDGGRKKFAVLETKRGIEVADRLRFCEALRENQGAAGSHRVHKHGAEQTFGVHGAQVKTDERSVRGN